MTQIEFFMYANTSYFYTYSDTGYKKLENHLVAYTSGSPSTTDRFNSSTPSKCRPRRRRWRFIVPLCGYTPAIDGPIAIPMTPFLSSCTRYRSNQPISRQIDRSAGVVSQNDAPYDVLCSGFRFILIAAGPVVSQSQISRRCNTRTRVSLGVHEVATHCTARRHWRNHLSMSAPRADIPRRKWSLAGSIDDRRSVRSAVYRRFYARVHALIESSRPRFTTPKVFRLFLDLAAVARKVFHLVVIFFIYLDEELSKRAQQLVMFIAGKRAARSATSSRFSRDSCTSPWKLRNISLLPSSCFLFWYFLQRYIWISKLFLIIRCVKRFDLHLCKQAFGGFTCFLINMQSTLTVFR